MVDVCCCCPFDTRVNVPAEVRHVSEADLCGGIYDVAESSLSSTEESSLHCVQCSTSETIILCMVDVFS